MRNTVRPSQTCFVPPACPSIQFTNVKISVVVHREMKRKSVWIQIETSNAFSVGAKDDSLSVPVIWASGAAGWFEISPADTYQSICDTMFQGVRLHYSLLDQYEEGLEMLQKSKKKKRTTFADVNLSLNELLFRVCYNSVPLCPCAPGVLVRAMWAFVKFELTTISVCFTCRRWTHSAGGL